VVFKTETWYEKKLAAYNLMILKDSQQNGGSFYLAKITDVLKTHRDSQLHFQSLLKQEHSSKIVALKKMVAVAFTRMPFSTFKNGCCSFYKRHLQPPFF